MSSLIDVLFSISASNLEALRSIEDAVLQDNIARQTFALIPRCPTAGNITIQSFLKIEPVQSSEFGTINESCAVIIDLVEDLKQRLKIIFGLMASELRLLFILSSEVVGSFEEKRMDKESLGLPRTLAHNHDDATQDIHGALLVLRGIRHRMKEVQHYAATPVVGGPKVLPEEHVRSIQYGMDRLQTLLLVAKKARFDVISIQSKRPVDWVV